MKPPIDVDAFANLGDPRATESGPTRRHPYDAALEQIANCDAAAQASPRNRALAEALDTVTDAIAAIS